MGEIVDFKFDPEIEKLANSLETAVKLEYSPNHKYYEVRNRHILERLKKEYKITDHIELAFALSEKLASAKDNNVTNLISELYIVYHEIAMEYVTKYTEVDDIPEYWQYNNEKDKNEKFLIKWACWIIKKLRRNKDTNRRYFNGLIYFYIDVMENLIEYNYLGK